MSCDKIGSSLFTLLFLLSIVTATTIATTAKDDSRQIISDLLTWADEEGGIVANIRVGNSAISGAGRALVAIESRNEGQVLVSLPVHLLITDETARASPLVQQHVLSFGEDQLSLDSCMTVTLFLMLEKLIAYESSYWNKYYRSLPSMHHDFNLPQFFWNLTESGKAALKVLMTSPSMAVRIEKEQELHQNALRKLNSTVFTSILHQYPHLTPQLVLETFLWAKSNILTRSWTKAHSSIQGECTMVPILDLLNHQDSGGGLVAVAFEDKPDVVHSVGVLATKAISSEEEIVDSYDPPDSSSRITKEFKCRQEMLIGFGFLPSLTSERHWCFDITINIKVTTFAHPTLNMLRLKLFAQLGATPGQQFTTKFREGDTKLPSSLLAAMRLCTCGEKEMAVVKTRGEATSALSVENERKVLRMIHNVMQVNVRAIPSSHAEDLMMLQSNTIDNKMRIALEVRVHERMICLQAIEHIKTAWAAVLLNDKLWGW